MLTVVVIAVVLSCIFYYVPVCKGISSGFSIIVCAVCAALFGAIVFPVRDAAENQAEEGQA